MPTLQELQRQNQRLKNEISAKKELLEIQRERTRLEQENSRLIRQQKFGKQIAAGKAAGELTAKVGGKIGRGLFKVAKQIAENQRRAAIMERKAMRAKSPVKVKSPSRKKVAKRKKR